MSLTVPDYIRNARNFVQGPGLAYYAPYVTAGGDPATNAIVPVGLFSEDGLEFGHKPTFSDVKSDQSTYPLTTYLTDQELELKITLQEMSPTNLLIAFGLKPEALDAGPPTVLSFGEVFDIISALSLPTTRPVFRQFVFRMPGPGFDEQTTPKAGWMFLQVFKATVVAHSAPKVGKKHLMTVQATIRAYADYTIDNSIACVGKLSFPEPGV
jgi:hypothetical protein